MAAPGVIVTKRFTFRGNPEEWANLYHFQGSAPADPAGWRALVDDLITLELPAIGHMVAVISALCYENTDDDSVYSYDLAAFGGTRAGGYFLTDEGAAEQMGDTAYMARWDTGRQTSKSKPIYLRKYFHPAMTIAPAFDTVPAGLLAQVDAYAEAVMSSSGDWPGLAGPDGVAPVGWRAMPYVTTRTLKRRGRRPT